MEPTSANRHSYINNKPDIVISDNEKGTCVLKDVAMSGDRNVIRKKLRNFTEIHRIWNMKGNVIPVIIGATGTI